MATGILVSEAEYLTTSYEHDCEWADGEVIERSMPTPGHARVQGRFFSLSVSDPLSPLQPSVESRVKIGSRYRIIDFCVYAGPVPNVPSTPPLVAAEVLSPDDKMSAVLDRLQEYRDWGVPHIWLADPLHRVLYRFDERLTAVDAVAVQEHSILITAHDLFLGLLPPGLS